MNFGITNPKISIKIGNMVVLCLHDVWDTHQDDEMDDVDIQCVAWTKEQETVSLMFSWERGVASTEGEQDGHRDYERCCDSIDVLCGLCEVRHGFDMDKADSDDHDTSEDAIVLFVVCMCKLTGDISQNTKDDREGSVVYDGIASLIEGIARQDEEETQDQGQMSFFLFLLEVLESETDASHDDDGPEDMSDTGAHVCEWSEVHDCLETERYPQ